MSYRAPLHPALPRIDTFTTHSPDGYSDSEGTRLLSAVSRSGLSTPRRFSHGSSVYSYNDSKYPGSPFSPDQHTSFVPILGADGVLVSHSTPYDPAEVNYGRDPDDALHDPDPPGAKIKRSGSNMRGWSNVLSLGTLVAVVIGLFLIYPITDWIARGGIMRLVSNNQFVNGTGQAAVLAGMPKLVDPDTPAEFHTRTGFDGQEYELVFSDEFNKDHRTFFPGDDPFWEAQDIWYGATRDLEWYDPDAAYTEGGFLKIKLDRLADPSINHNLSLKSAMLTTWNKFCFTSGYIEARVQLPGLPKTSGYWPGVWIIGNLGRPGFGATTDGLWPYSYDSCDVGVMPNQTDANGPPAALVPLQPAPAGRGRPDFNYQLSMLPGQRLSACTCKGQDHPGPWLDSENRFRGRGAPEIDVIEAQKCKRRGPDADACVSQSAQFAPFDLNYDFVEAGVSIESPHKTERNYFHGSALQQSVSCISNVTNSTMRDGPGGGGYGIFGFEYFADDADPSQSYVSWVSDGERSHTVRGTAVPPREDVMIGQRLVAAEPMTIVLNLGVSEGFQPVDDEAMTYPNYLTIDYVRIWQRKGTGENGVSCDPPGYPTTKYIQDHYEAYVNPNITTWSPKYDRPLNRWRDPGSC